MSTFGTSVTRWSKVCASSSDENDETFIEQAGANVREQYELGRHYVFKLSDTNVAIAQVRLLSRVDLCWTKVGIIHCQRQCQW